MTIDERLESLERQNRRMKLAIFGMIAVMVTGCAMGLRATRDETRHERVLTADVIRAGRIEVFGAGERPVVVLSENRDATGGVVFVNNDTGYLIAQMGAADDRRGVVWTYTPEGELRDEIR